MGTYQVIIQSVPSETIPLLRAIRLIANSSIREAKELVLHLQSVTPCTLIAGVSRSVAEHALLLLTQADAVATLEESTTPHPMVLQPDINRIRRASFLFARRTRG